MKSILVVTAVLLATPAFAPAMGHSTTGRGPVKVIFNSGDKKLKLVEGFNPLSRAKTFQCENNAGCVVGASATVQLNTGGQPVYLCTYIDGKQAKPVCGKTTAAGSDVPTLRQYDTVPFGVHIIQTMLYSYDTCCGPTVVAWETEYTIYAQK